MTACDPWATGLAQPVVIALASGLLGVSMPLRADLYPVVSLRYASDLSMRYTEPGRIYSMHTKPMFRYEIDATVLLFILEAVRPRDTLGLLFLHGHVGSWISVHLRYAALCILSLP